MDKPSPLKFICHISLAIGPLILILVLYVIYDEAIAYRLTGGYFPGSIPIYIILSLISLIVASELRLTQTKTDNAPRPLHLFWIIAPMGILALFMFSGSRSLQNLATLIIIYSCIPLPFIVVLRLMIIKMRNVRVPIHPFGIIAPIGILVLFMSVLWYFAWVIFSLPWYFFDDPGPGLWERLANKIPSVSYGGTSKVLRTWPDRDHADGQNWDPKVAIILHVNGNRDKFKLTDGWILSDGFNGESGDFYINFHLADMTCWIRDGEYYTLNTESLSKLMSINGLSYEDRIQLAEDAYQSIMEVKAAKSEDDLDSTYEPMWSHPEYWAVRLVGGVVVAIAALPVSFLLTNRYLKKCIALKQSNQ